MPRQALNTASRAPTTAPANKPPDVAQLRELLNALTHFPVGVMQHVGFLLMVYISAVATATPDYTVDERLTVGAKLSWERFPFFRRGDNIKTLKGKGEVLLRAWAVRGRHNTHRLLGLLSREARVVNLRDARLIQQSVSSIAAGAAVKVWGVNSTSRVLL